MTRTPSEVAAFNEGVEAAAKLCETRHRAGTAIDIRSLTLPIPAASPVLEAERLVETAAQAFARKVYGLSLTELHPKTQQKFAQYFDEAIAIALQSAAATEAKLREALVDARAALNELMRWSTYGKDEHCWCDSKIPHSPGCTAAKLAYPIIQAALGKKR